MSTQPRKQVAPKGQRKIALNDHVASMRLMKAVVKRVRKEIDKLRPQYTYATVVDINPADLTCRVINDPTDPLDQAYRVQCNGSTLPTAAGQKVRIAGAYGDRYVDGVIGQTDTEWPGVIKMYGAATPPAGHLACNGAAVSRTDYAALFAVIGTNYGVGDGSTTFNVPDFRSRFPIGANPTVGTAGGSASHSHGLSASGQAQIMMTGAVVVFKQAAVSGGFTADYQITATRAASTATPSFGTALSGNTDSTSTLPPWLSTTFIIKT